MFFVFFSLFSNITSECKINWFTFIYCSRLAMKIQIFVNENERIFAKKKKNNEHHRRSHIICKAYYVIFTNMMPFVYESHNFLFFPFSFLIALRDKGWREYMLGRIMIKRKICGNFSQS